jgi:hypothetical protein
MKNLSRVILVFVLLLLVTGVASAARPEPEPFSTTGYSTNLVANPFFDPSQPPSATNPPLLPSEFVPLPSSHIKFHISAEGGPAVNDDAICLALYDAPCDAVCVEFTGQVCGVTGMFADGNFSFEEWGLYCPTPVVIPQGVTIGANYGDMNIFTDSGEANFRFGGQVFVNPLDLLEQTVQGSFHSVKKGTGEYKKLKVDGTYQGNAGYVFTVDYSPCEDGNCQNRCAVFGGEKLKVKKDKVEWKIENDGANLLTVSNITLNWQGSDRALDKVKLGGKTIDDEPLSQPSVVPGVSGQWSNIDLSGWEGKEKDIQIKSGKKAKLTFEFVEGISQEPSDYTILVEFAEGCAVTFVDFPTIEE